MSAFEATAYGPREAVADWLRANDIDPCDVPLDAHISIEPLTLGGDRCIRYTAVVRDEGHVRYDPQRRGPASEQRIAVLKADPPADVLIDGSTGD
ncbi:hypothetical protein ACFWHF_12070 [Streptomyces griseoincarnatus]|uniref:Aminoglycoside phosphotransferase n=1 Tax=Streptomyces cellulosae TaxID=1968 RepID=A0ABW6JL63_STRCE